MKYKSSRQVSYDYLRQRIATHEMRITKLQKTLQFLVLEQKMQLQMLLELQDRYRNHLRGFHNVK